ncbi:MAG: VCBS repeat-containing protein [Lewinellaceae bacterium]|nr:VCBS repeat-containing protein [Lewinellaceae bacterium]
MKKLLYLSGLLLLLACNKEPGGNDRLFTSIPESSSGVHFENNVVNNEDLNIFTYRNFYNGGGVAIGDINNDGLPDIYFTANMGENKLYLNKGDWKFEDITASAGVGAANKWSTGVVLVDINADGFLDIYVCNAGYVSGQDQKNLLFINNQDLTFTEKGAEYGLDDNGYTTHAAFLDYDKDGDLDVYLLNNSFIPTNTLNYSNKRDLPARDWPVKEFLKGGGDKFLRNDNGKFVDVSDEAGIYQSLIGFGLGVTVGDINDDGYDDLYISNDFFERDYLYLNQGNGTFKESLEDYFSHISHSSMGADLRDINNDGLMDLFVTDMLPNDDYRLKTTASFDDINLRRLKVESGFYNQFMHNTLQINKGKKFKEVAFHAGVAASDWSWGALMFDADNDRYTDIIVCNGIFHDVIDLDFMDFFANEVIQKMALTGKKEDMNTVIDKMPSKPLSNLAFHNISGYRFENASKEWGLDKETFSNGAAYGDLDNDGDLDLVINNVNQPALLYRNNTRNKSLEVRLEGKAPNTKAIGAKVYLYSPGSLQYQQVNPSRGFQSSVEYQLLFGLGSDPKIDSLLIVWPDGQDTVLHPSPTDRVVQVAEAGAGGHYHKPAPANGLFAAVPNTFQPHIEDDYVDYYYERGVHRMLSKEGPKACVADVNGDGKEDVFICGATDQPGRIYIQTAAGFAEKPQPALNKHLKFEDTACRFFDADNDGDQDLMVGSGGNQYQPNDPNLVDRLYLNDGAGNFTPSAGFTSEIGMNTSEILAHDYDGDGDQDLFIFSRSVPRHYGFNPAHFAFKNDGQGHFTDVSKELFNNFSGVGMVTSAVFENVMGDAGKELIVVGEWDYPRIFAYDGTRFTEQTTNLSDYNGWYFKVAAADLDSDGDMDLIFGNTGSNCYVYADQEAPLSLWINDFDDNGTVDKIMTQRTGGRDMPIMLKKDMQDQITAIKKGALRHSDYATKSIQELFPGPALEKAGHRNCNYMLSSIAWNDGDGHFRMEALPEDSQLSSIKAILPVDVDGDGDIDLLTGGNDFNLIPQFSRLDASFGGLLLNDGKGQLRFVDENTSNIWIDGEVKDIQPIRVNGGNQYLFLINNASPELIKSVK